MRRKCVGSLLEILRDNTHSILNELRFASIVLDEPPTVVLRRPFHREYSKCTLYESLLTTIIRRHYYNGTHPKCLATGPTSPLYSHFFIIIS